MHSTEQKPGLPLVTWNKPLCRSLCAQAPCDHSCHLPQLCGLPLHRGLHLPRLPACLFSICAVASLPWGGCRGQTCCKLGCSRERKHALPVCILPVTVQLWQHTALGAEDCVLIAGSAGRTEDFPLFNFGISVRSFSSCPGETEGGEKRYLKETEGNFNKETLERNWKEKYCFLVFLRECFLQEEEEHKRH